MSELLEAALKYAARRWYVFPVDGKGDHYTGKGGHRNATTDEVVIREWWERWPDANIGVWLRKSGLIAIDVDVDGKPGRATIAKLEAKYGPLPRDCNQRSPSGGEHVIMLDPWGDPDSHEPVRGNFGKGSGVDIKCNGYVLLSPSRTDKGQYEWIAQATSKAVPKKWRPQLKPKDVGAGGDVIAWQTTKNVGRDVKDLQGELRAIGPHGEGGTMWRAVCTIFEDFGLSIDDGWPYLVAWNARRNEPLTDGALMRQIDRVAARKAGRGARFRVVVKKRDASDVELVSMFDVEATKVRWLWEGYVPFGKITILEGDPGLGKSTLALDIAARVSTGAPMPRESQPRDPSCAVIMTAEDDLSDTVRPRLDAAGVDARRVFAWVAIRDDGGNLQMPTLTDLEALEGIIERTRASLVIVDPLMAFLGGKTDAHRDQDIRTALAPLSKIAERTAAAILIIRHLNKGSGRAVYRGGGSIGIGGAARSVLVVAKDPEDEDSRVMAPVKANLSTRRPSIKYGVVDSNTVGRIEWRGESDLTADDLLGGGDGQAKPSLTGEAVEWLRSFLADGPKLKAEIEAAAEAYGYTDKHLRVARERLGVVDQREPKKGARTIWALRKGGAS